MKKSWNNFYTTLICITFNVAAFAQTGMDCDSFCVESITIDTNVAQGFIVTIKNYNMEHVNYPTINVIDKATNMQIATDSGKFSYFAHITGVSLAYNVSSNTAIIPDSAIVTITDNIWNITCQLPYPCAFTNAIQETNANALQYFWNGNQITLSSGLYNKIEIFNLVDVAGRNIAYKIIQHESKIEINVDENVKSGIYFLNGVCAQKYFTIKIAKI